MSVASEPVEEAQIRLRNDPQSSVRLAQTGDRLVGSLAVESLAVGVRAL